jgi:REP element-mobilizing transposase RayT
MRYDPKVHHRRSIRKRGYDYSYPGWYFITLCTEGKEHTFGSVVEWRMKLNEPGRMVENLWNFMPQRFPGIILDEFVAMPNHFHAIFQIAPPTAGAPLLGAQGGQSIVGAPLVGAQRGQSIVGAPLVGAPTRAGTSPAPTVGEIVGAFKSLTANEYFRNVQLFGWKTLPKGLWQRNFYEHIIRNDRELEAMRAYIRENPARWDSDPEYS